jgi:transcriptional regulator with XRE-family HTH domain
MAAFAKRLGVSISTLYRLEHAEQSATLRCVEQILNRLHCALDDIFLDEYRRHNGPDQ